MKIGRATIKTKQTYMAAWNLEGFLVVTFALRICALSVAGGMRRCEGSGELVVATVVVVETSVDTVLLGSLVVDSDEGVVDETVSLCPIKSTLSLLRAAVAAVVDTSSLFITKILQTTKNVSTMLENCIFDLDFFVLTQHFIFQLYFF